LGAARKKRFELTGTRSREAFIGCCRTRGIRMGRTRTVIAKRIVEADGVFDFDFIWNHICNGERWISRGTIYSSLRRFRDAGLIREIMESTADRPVADAAQSASGRGPPL